MPVITYAVKNSCVYSFAAPKNLHRVNLRKCLSNCLSWNDIIPSSYTRNSRVLVFFGTQAGGAGDGNTPYSRALSAAMNCPIAACTSGVTIKMAGGLVPLVVVELGYLISTWWAPTSLSRTNDTDLPWPRVCSPRTIFVKHVQCQILRNQMTIDNIAQQEWTTQDIS